MGKSGLDIDGYRERVASAVGTGVSELIASEHDDPNAAMLRMVAAYLLLQRDGGTRLRVSATRLRGNREDFDS